MQPVLKAALLIVGLTAAAYDIRFRRIPNWVTMSGVVVGIATNLSLFGGRGLAISMLGLLLAFAVYLPLYLIRGMGAGDVKLMAAVGSIVGAIHWLGIFLATAILGGIVSFILVLLKNRLQETLLNLSIIGVELAHLRVPATRAESVDVRSRKALRLPHGAVIAGGCLAYLLYLSR